MIKSLTINHKPLTTIWWVILLALILFGITKIVFAEDSPEDIAKKYGITFPIIELGHCVDYSACRTYCEDPVNSVACINYAKAKGFYEDDELETKKDEILNKAKQELGCDSFESCSSFCQVSLNHDKCDSFARANNLNGGHTANLGEAKIVEKAKQILGCSSKEDCMSFCQEEANRQKCSDFAKEVGLRGGEQRVGPGGCNSEETCKAFCQDPNNYKICSGFGSSEGGHFTGPGGCSSEESCKAYCQQHENECRHIEGGLQGQFNHQEMCNKTPNCSWNGNTCQCSGFGDEKRQSEDYAKFCKENPNKCKPGESASFATPEHRAEFEKYCSENPEKCGATPGGGETYSHDPATECVKYGCSWTNNTCQCTSSRTSTTTTGTYSPPPSGGYSSDPVIGCVQAGCTWTNNTCQCLSSTGTYSYPTPSYPTPSGTYGTPSYGTPSSGSDPSTDCAKHTGCTWSNNTCQCLGYPTPAYGTPSYGTPAYGTPSYGTPSYGTPSYGTPSESSPMVHGIYTHPSLFQIIIHQFLGF